MDSSINKKNNGWPVCIGCALLLFAVIGILVQSFSIFQPYFISARNFSNTQVSLLMTIRTLTSVVVLTAVDLYYKKNGYQKGTVYCRTYRRTRRSHLRFCRKICPDGSGHDAAGVMPGALFDDPDQHSHQQMVCKKQGASA